MLFQRKLKGFPDGTIVEGPPASAGDARDTGLIPGLGRSPGGGNGSPFQCSCLENSMDREAWRATAHGGPKGLDPTEHIRTRTHTYTHTHTHTHTDTKIKFYTTVEKLENSGKYKGKQNLE